MSTTPRCLFKSSNTNAYGVAYKLVEFWSDKTVRYNIAGVEDPHMRSKWTVENGILMATTTIPDMSGLPRYIAVKRYQPEYDAYIASLVVE